MCRGRFDVGLATKSLSEEYYTLKDMPKSVVEARIQELMGMIIAEEAKGPRKIVPCGFNHNPLPLLYNQLASAKYILDPFFQGIPQSVLDAEDAWNKSRENK